MSKIKQQISFKVHQSAEVLFPLFSPEGEKHWVPGWDYENVMGGTDLHEDYVFLTIRSPSKCLYWVLHFSFLIFL